MKKISFFYITFLLILAITGVGFTQDVTQITFLSELDNKAAATYGDALIIFKLQSGSTAAVKRKSSSKGNSFTLPGYTEGNLLTRGMASLMAARYLDLGGSFMYMIFDTERYAYKACIANDIFAEGGSENDKMTGPELIEFLTRISDMKGGK